MRNRVFFLFVISFFLLLANCGPTEQEALEYHQKITHEQYEVIKHLSKIDEIFTTFNADSIETVLNTALNQTNSSIEVLENMDELGDESKLKESCLEFFIVIKGQIENEYHQKLEIYKLPIKEYDSIQQERFIEIHMALQEKYFSAFDKFAEAEENFAEEWGFELEAADL